MSGELRAHAHPRENGRAAFTVLGISGSLRAASYNSRVLHMLPPLAPQCMKLQIFEGLRALPLFDEDLEREPILPPPVIHLCDEIRAADGIVIATPEYNHSIPGALKNAIDWASRPHGRGALSGKPVAVLVATVGPKAGFRGLAETIRILTDLGNLVVPEPQVVIQSAHTAISADPRGKECFADPLIPELLAIQLEALADLIQAGAASVALQAARRHRDTVLRALDIREGNGDELNSPRS